MKIHTGHQGIEKCRLRARDKGLPSPADVLFGRKIQSNLPIIATTRKEKARFHRREQWRRQYDEHDLKDIHPGQSVRVQDYVGTSRSETEG